MFFHHISRIYLIKKFQAQITRIQTKLAQARELDPGRKVFGASNHRYKLYPPASLEDVQTLEAQYGIQLPESYKAFVLDVGNGGPSYLGSGAGPFYGIFKLGEYLDELVYVDTEKHLKNPCVLKPHMAEEEWKEISHNIREDDDISDEVYDQLLGKIYAGILPLGSQGCAYVHGLVLNGPYKGKVVNLNPNHYKPRFTYEDHFLDWYERWLDEVISGDLLTKGISWFGYTRGGPEESLIALFQNSTDETVQNEVLVGLLQKRKVSTTTLHFLDTLYPSTEGEQKWLCLQALTKFSYAKAKPYLVAEAADHMREVFQFVYWYTKDRSYEWKSFIQQHIHQIQDLPTLKSCLDLMKGMEREVGNWLLPFISHQDMQIRKATFYALGEFKRKEQYIALFIQGLDDPSPEVLRNVLQALKGIKNPILLKHLQAVAQRFPEEQDYILINLDAVLKDYGLDVEGIRTMSLEELEPPTPQRKWYQIWKKREGS